MASADNKQEELLKEIDKLTKNLKGTNFECCLKQHFECLSKYVGVVREKKEKAFPDEQTAHAFYAAKVFYDKLKFLLFQKPEDTVWNFPDDEDDNMPPIEAFHYTPDEIEMKKNIILNNMKLGDVLNLIVVGENEDHYKLKILNKYNEKERIVDVKLIAYLGKAFELVKEIVPPLEVNDFVRAANFGNYKVEENSVVKYKQIVITLRQDKIQKKELQHLSLGRISKSEIPYYPVDIDNCETFGSFLKQNRKEDDLRNIRKYGLAFGCDPTTTGPFYETQNEKKIRDDEAIEEERKQKLSTIYKKTVSADRLLKAGNLKSALSEIQVVFKLNPINDVALTIRGKIYLAMAGGKPSPYVKNAFLDFESALRINRFNPDALSLRDSILIKSSERFKAQNKLEKVKAIENAIRGRTPNENTLEFLDNIEKKKAENDVKSAIVKKEL